MLKRIGIPVFLATVCYQVLDAGAAMLLPQYDTAGYPAALLFWVLPFSVAFILGYKAVSRNGEPLRQRTRHFLYTWSAVGAGAGQLLGFAAVIPSNVFPDLTPVGMVIESLITSVFVLIGAFGGVTTAQSVQDEGVFTTRTALLLGSLAMLLGVATVYDPAGTPFNATFNFLLGIWLFTIARYA